MRRTSQRDDELPVVDVREIVNPRSYTLYGRAGTGKTTVAATFPKPMLYLDVSDKGTDSIRDVEGISVRQIESFEEFEDTYYWLTRHPDEYKTVVIDTVSQLQSIMIKELAIKKKKNVAKAGDWGSMTKGDWGDIAGVLKNIFVDFRDLPLNVVFIAQDRTFNVSDDEDAERDEMTPPEVGPALMPSVAKTLNAAVSVIANTFIRMHTVTKKVGDKKVKKESIQYCLGIGPHAIYTRKIRRPKGELPPDYIVNPTYEDIIAVINGDL